MENKASLFSIVFTGKKDTGNQAALSIFRVSCLLSSSAWDKLSSCSFFLSELFSYTAIEGPLSRPQLSRSTDKASRQNFFVSAQKYREREDLFRSGRLWANLREEKDVCGWFCEGERDRKEGTSRLKRAIFMCVCIYTRDEGHTFVDRWKEHERTPTRRHASFHLTTYTSLYLHISSRSMRARLLPTT